MQGARIKWQVKDTASTFDDLDHLINVYIRPMLEKAKEVSRSSKFVSGADLPVTESAVNQALLRDNSRASYMFCKGPAPGVYYLVYKFSPTSTVQHERIYLGPGNFVFRTEKPANLDALIRYFKKNPKPTNRQAPTTNFSNQYGSTASYGTGSHAAGASASYGTGATPSYGIGATASYGTGATGSYGTGSFASGQYQPYRR
jgi:hypothetical protein